MRLKASAILVGAIVASAFPTPIKHDAMAQGSAIDPFLAAPQETVTVPEFVPVINFSEFLLAVEQSSDRSTREAAEALSAKFAAASPPADTLSDAEPALLRPTGPSPTILGDAQGRPALADASDAEASMAPDPRPVHTPTPDPVRPDVKITSVAPIAAENAGEPVKAAAAARDDDAENAKPEGIVKARPARRFKPAMGLGASGIAVIIRPKNQRSEHSERRAARAEKVSERTPAKSPAKFAAVDNDDQRGIPGQAWEPLISSCAKVKRDCNGATFCGC